VVRAVETPATAETMVVREMEEQDTSSTVMMPADMIGLPRARDEDDEEDDEEDE